MFPGQADAHTKMTLVGPAGEPPAREQPVGPAGEPPAREHPIGSPWNHAQWDTWTPGTAPTELPPVAVAALADAIASTGNSPACMIADLKAELLEAAENGDLDAEQIASETAAIDRLQAELCSGPPPRVCVKCRQHPRIAPMVHCGHVTLCTACQATVLQHIVLNPSRASKLARLMCPFCRGFELAVSVPGDRPQRSGHLLCLARGGGQECAHSDECGG